MNRGPVRCLSAVLGVLAVLVLVLPGAASANGARHGLRSIHPLIFIHGGEGSAAQFESQKMRFTSNGYPSDYVRALDYDSLFLTETRDQVYSQLDDLIAQVKQSTGASQVDLAAHSLGTSLMHTYLDSSTARAANVAHYVNLDGMTSTSPPGGVPTLALFATKGATFRPGASIGGATNVSIPDSTHVQLASSPVSFGYMFKFLTGHWPRTTDIVPARSPFVHVSGRAVLFPQNTGLDGVSLAIWRTDPATGRRLGDHPVYTQVIPADGSFGPARLLRGVHYEFALTSAAFVQHLYYEPFIRDDSLVRLLSTAPGEIIYSLLEPSPIYSGFVATRNKEFWGDQGAENDELTVNGQNLINAADAPVSKLLIGLFVFDHNKDGVSNLSTPVPGLSGLPFLNAVDDSIPAGTPPNATVEVSLRSRGAGPVRTLAFPNFASTTDLVSLQFNDFECYRFRLGCGEPHHHSGWHWHH